MGNGELDGFVVLGEGRRKNLDITKCFVTCNRFLMGLIAFCSLSRLS